MVVMYGGREVPPMPEPSCTPDEWNHRRVFETALVGLPTWERIRTDNLRYRYEKDLGDDLSTARSALLNRAIAMQVQLELWDSRALIGFALPEDYTKIATAMLRLLKELGLDRQARDVTNELEAYVLGKDEKPAPIEERMPAWWYHRNEEACAK